MPPVTIGEQVTRINQFIEKIRDARKQKDEKAVAETKKSEAKAKSEAKRESKASEILRVQVEPVLATLEEALEVAKACVKCYATKVGTKGCRTCMGEWFEHIRQRRRSRSSFWLED